MILGLCCRHRLHPVKFKERIVLLLGSVSCGLTVTNATFLYFLLADKNLVGERLANNTFLIAGAIAHSFFDFAMRNMVACGCIKLQCCRVAGWSVSVFITISLVLILTVAVIARVFRGQFDDAEQCTSEDGVTKTRITIDGNGELDVKFLLGVFLICYLAIGTNTFFQWNLGVWRLASAWW